MVTVNATFDDIDGTRITADNGSTVTLSINDEHYEIDLTAENQKELLAALQPYLGKARRIKKAPSPRIARPKSSDTSETARLRKWARENGRPLPARGRIPKDVRDDFEAAQLKRKPTARGTTAT